MMSLWPLNESAQTERPFDVSKVKCDPHYIMDGV